MEDRNLWRMAGVAVMGAALMVLPMTGVRAEGTVEIRLSDDEILVDGDVISADMSAAVHTGAEIIYYKAGQGATYGEGDESDGHSQEEAAEQTVITITQPGTYRVSGSISKGQIAVDMGEESRGDSSAVVNLILDNAEITCDVAPGIVVYNAYECGSDDPDTAAKDVDTTGAGFNLILADDSVNTVNGSHVAKIYKEGTTQEEVDAGEAKKAWKFDAAIDSLVSFNISGEETGNGKLRVTADNEGISSALHLTMNGGEVVINSADDSMNASEDYVSVLTVNGGVIICDSDLGNEGDGIDSNGWIVINDGFIVAGANGQSADSGVDADMGIYTNGGTLLASGNMYDQVEADSAQPFIVLNFAQPVDEGQILLLKDSEGNPVTAFSPINTCQTIVYSCDNMAEGDYTLYKVSSVAGGLNGSIYTNITDYTDEVQLQHGGMMMGFGGGQRPEGMEMPEGMEPGPKPERMEMPEGMEPGQRPEGMEMPMGTEQSGESSVTFSISGIRNQFAQIAEVVEESAA